MSDRAETVARIAREYPHRSADVDAVLAAVGDNERLARALLDVWAAGMPLDLDVVRRQMLLAQLRAVFSVGPHEMFP